MSRFWFDCGDICRVVAASGGIMFWMHGSLADIGELVRNDANFGHSSVVI